MEGHFYYVENGETKEQMIHIYDINDSLTQVPEINPVTLDMLQQTANIKWIGKSGGFVINPSYDDLASFNQYPYYSDEDKLYGLGKTVLSPNNEYGAVIMSGPGINQTLRPAEGVKVYLAMALVNSIYRLGFYIEKGSTWAFGYGLTSDHALNKIAETLVKDPSAGGKGFHPTGSRTKHIIPGIGGRGKIPSDYPIYKTDIVTQPDAPDESVASAAGSGFIRAYKVDSGNLANFGRCLYSQTLLDYLGGLRAFVNPMDGVISLNVFPYNPSVGGSEAIKILNHSCTTHDLGKNANGSPLSSQFKQVDFGTLNVNEEWGSFLDYANTSAELYLPFIGKVDIDVTEVMNGTINVKYTIDFFTGLCVANVLCTKTLELPDGRVITGYSQHSYQGNCAVNIPLTSNDYGAMVGSLMNACSQGLRTGNAASAIISLGGEALSGGLRPNVSTKGSITANAGFCSVLYPYVTLTRPISAEPWSYQEVVGYPSFIDEYLGECEGYCECIGIDLDGIPYATDNEYKRIEQMCLEGVYI